MEPEKLTPKQFELFRDFIYRHSGIRIDISKVTLISNRIRRRLKAHNLADFDTYYRLVSSAAGQGEMECFLDAVTTNETHFFRTPTHFEWFRTNFLLEVLSNDRLRSPSKQLRIWSAACSTGEEAYSLAICLQENAFRLRDWKLAVVGTDISESVLKEARLGVYRAKSLELVEEQRLKRYFDAAGDGETWAIRQSVKELVQFRWQNLMEPLKLPPFNCIFIRNVLIYFDRESKQQVIRNLIQSLVPGGYLVVGPSEGIYDMLDPLVKRTTFAYQKPLSQ